MGQRGRKSRDDLTVIDGSIKRPSPPAELTKEQSDEWRAIVNELPADQLSKAQHGLLAAYCRHMVAMRHVAQLIEQLEYDNSKPLDMDEYDRLLKMQDRESSKLATLAIRLGFAKHTGPTKGGGPPSAPAPWED